MRRILLLLVALLALLSPGLALAQQPSEEEDELPSGAGDEAAEGQLESEQAAGAEGTAIQDGGYEPDQRGATEEESDSAPAPEAEPRVMQTGGGGAAESYAGDAALDVSSGSFFGLELSLWLGGALSSLEAVSNDNLVRADQQGALGAGFGLSVGARFGPISVGPRVGFVVDPSFVLATIGLDVRATLLPEALSPTLRVALSYALLTGVADALPSQPGADGVHTELGVGLRWRFLGPLELGAELSGGYLHLERGAVQGCEAPCADGRFDLARPGTSDGLTLRVDVFTGARF